MKLSPRFFPRRIRKQVLAVPRPVLAILLIGVVLRIGFWLLTEPNWRLSATYYPLHFDLLEYVSNFEGYKHSRMPFFDVIVAGSYVMFADVLGRRSLTLVNVVVAIASLPLFYGCVKRFFSKNVALFALLLYAFMPKILVISGQGMPEPVSVGFIVISLYAVSRAIDADRSGGWYILAGIFAMLSFTMFVPAVAFSVLLAVYLYVREEGAGFVPKSLPGRDVWLFSLVPGIVGSLYLILGPVRKMMATTTGDFGSAKTSLFADPAAYSWVEKAVRHVAYAYFDFWWHGRGFEDESALRGALVGYQSLFDDLFVLYILGWASLTLLLTVLIVVGVYVLIRKKGPLAWFILAWIGVYLLVYHARNIGWTGVFNTRHVLPIFPAVCIAFGLGSAAVLSWYRRLQRRGVGVSIPKTTARTVLLVVLVMTTGVLITNGAAESAVKTGAHDISRAGAVEQLQSVVEPGETVAVTEFGAYHTVVIYSGFTIRPVILVQSEKQQRVVELRTVRGDVRLVSPPELSSQDDLDYLYVVESNQDRFSADQRAYIEAGDRLGDVVVRETLVRERPQRRTINIAIVRLDNSTGRS